MRPLVQRVRWPVLQTALRHVSGRSPRGDGDACRLDRQAHRQPGRLGNWSRTQAVPADCLCLRKDMGLWPMAGPALGPQYTTASTQDS